MKYTKKMRFNDYDDNEIVERDLKQRRPIRNWTKAYVEHESEYDELEDFHRYRIKP